MMICPRIYNEARCQHALYLYREEGTLKKAGKRLGVRAEQVRQLILRHGRTLKKMETHNKIVRMFVK
jgi:DNA-directed RNA polymerase sigma subunit (sigma70/sigma32)